VEIDREGTGSIIHPHDLARRWATHSALIAVNVCEAMSILPRWFWDESLSCYLLTVGQPVSGQNYTPEK
jgi:hypothetical protein